MYVISVILSFSRMTLRGWLGEQLHAKLALKIINHFSISLWNPLHRHHRFSSYLETCMGTRPALLLSTMRVWPILSDCCAEDFLETNKSLIKRHKQSAVIHSLQILHISVVHPNGQQQWLSTKQMFLSPSNWGIIIVEHIFFHELLDEASIYRGLISIESNFIPVNVQKYLI